MELSSLIGTLVSSDTVKNIAGTVKSDSSSVKKVLSAALPSLLNGAKAQSEDAASGFAEALRSHGEADTANIAGFLKNVDLKDGKKIIGHLLGSTSSEQIAEIARAAGVSKKSTGNILSAAAPLLMSLLGKQSSGSGSLISSLFSGLDIGSLLTGLLTDNDEKEEEKEEEKPASGGFLSGLFGKLFK